MPVTVKPKKIWGGKWAKWRRVGEGRPGHTTALGLPRVFGLLFPEALTPVEAYQHVARRRQTRVGTKSGDREPAPFPIGRPGRKQPQVGVVALISSRAGPVLTWLGGGRSATGHYFLGRTDERRHDH
jgi:hypothetical protein